MCMHASAYNSLKWKAWILFQEAFATAAPVAAAAVAAAAAFKSVDQADFG